VSSDADRLQSKATGKKNRKWWDGLKQEQMMDIQTEKV
jgi:hypothetical protein